MEIGKYIKGKKSQKQFLEWFDKTHKQRIELIEEEKVKEQ